MPRKYALAAFVLVLMVGVGIALMARVRANGSVPAGGPPSLQVARGPFVRTLRLTGIIESVRYHNVTAPRLVGVTGPTNTLIITKLARGGSQVAAGDLLVEFDRQTQLKAAFDKRAQYLRFRGADSQEACGAGAGEGQRRCRAGGRGECRRDRAPRDEEERARGEDPC